MESPCRWRGPRTGLHSLSSFQGPFCKVFGLVFYFWSFRVLLALCTHRLYELMQHRGLSKKKVNPISVQKIKLTQYGEKGQEKPGSAHHVNVAQWRSGQEVPEPFYDFSPLIRSLAFVPLLHTRASPPSPSLSPAAAAAAAGEPDHEVLSSASSLPFSLSTNEGCICRSRTRARVGTTFAAFFFFSPRVD
jgi:hypothetical protein